VNLILELVSIEDGEFFLLAEYLLLSP
jgi:hypothetical protein